jgi:hypothetical protein
MKNSTIFFIGLLSCWSDAATSILASHYPELTEGNPQANPLLELGSVLTGQAVILYGGEKLKANPKITRALALAVAAPPFCIAAKNLALVAVIKARTYPWQTCPLLYNG